MRSKTNFRKNLRKTRSITAAAFILLGFLLARVTELPTQLEYKYFLQNTIFWGTDSQYSTIFFPVAVDRSMFPQSTSSVARAVFFARHKSCGLSKYNYKLPSLKFPMTIMRAQPGVFVFLCSHSRTQLALQQKCTLFWSLFSLGRASIRPAWRMRVTVVR